MKTNALKIFIAGIFLLYSSCRPSITGFSPDYGPPGTTVEVRGSRLVSDGNPSDTQVRLNSLPQGSVSGSSTAIEFSVAEGSSTGRISISNSQGAATSAEEFQVVDNYEDGEGTFTFGGTDGVQAAKVSPSGTNQQIIFAICRAKWAPNTGVFDDFDDDVDNEFAQMNDFWSEASFGRVSFEKEYLTNQIIGLPRSKDYYYHNFQQRDIRGVEISEPVNFPSAKTLEIEYGSGLSFDVEFSPGDMTFAEIVDVVNDSIANISGTPPNINFTTSLSRFRIASTAPGKSEGHIELSGDAIPYLGFGRSSFYNISSDEPILMLFGAPIPATGLNFPSDVSLEINTQGSPTTVSFTAGSTLSAADIVTAIETAYPGEASQQPFEVEAVNDPLDSGQRLLVFKTRVDGDGDHGFPLTIDGSARTILGLGRPGELRRYEPETFRGYRVIQDGFNNYVSTLPAGTDLDPIFADARMFVGILADDNQLRAHHSSWAFPIGDESYEVNYFVARLSDLAPFAHETGHALGFPDLYAVDGIELGRAPDDWDIMDCSRCDAHSVAWLKSRHHRPADEQMGAWIDAGRIAEIGPPPAMTNETHEYILSPVESPWISSNPFAASHPGVEVVQAIELTPTDPQDVFFIENRQQGPYTANHLGDPVDFSTGLPGEGVIMYQGRRLPTSGLVDFFPVNLRTPYANPLNTVGETYEHIITSLNRINVEVLEKLLNPDMTGGAPSYSYHVRVSWGQGSFYDLAIREWNPPPWESEDIWVDNRAENDWDIYTYADDSGNPIQNGDNVAVGMPNRLYARVRNLGDIDVAQDFEVIWRIAVPQVAGGSIETELGRVTVTEDVPGNGSIITPPLVWTPGGSNEQHVCIKAEIVAVPGELNGTLNNSAQENLTQWFSEAASPFAPVTVNFETQNPYSDRSQNIRINAPDVPPGWTVTVEDVEMRLPPGGRRTQEVKVTPILGYFVERGLLRETGIIDELSVNIEAQVPFGDTWRAYGGITLVVHPVNENSTIELDPRPGERPGGAVVTGGMASSGVLSPSLTERRLHARIRGDNGIEQWIQFFSNDNGNIEVLIPNELRYQNLRVKVFYGGGNGFKPTSSNEIVVESPQQGNPPDIDFPGGVLDGVLGNGGLGNFGSLVKSGGYQQTLSGIEQLTVFAPADQAFSALSKTRREELMKNPRRVRELVEGHMVADRFDPGFQGSIRLKTLSGKVLTLSRQGKNLLVNGVKVSGKPVRTKNGTIFLLDGFVN